jgi:NDP-sugar pyrophosphorylase family protein
LTETFVVVYGDNVTALNFRDFVKAHDSSSIATIALLRRRNAGASGVVDLDGRNRITAFVEKPKLEPLSERWVNAGYLVVEPRIFEYIPAQRPSDFGMEVLPAALLAGEAMRAFPLHDPVWWIDSVEDYERVSADTRLAALASAWR